MKYLEELSIGESFRYQDQVYISTSDFKSNGNRLCINLSTGLPKWIESDSTVDVEPIYTLNKNNDIIPLKKYENSTDY